MTTAVSLTPSTEVNMESPTHSPFKVPSMPSTPLRQLSAEQMNQQPRLPPSPSLHSYLNENSHRSPRHRDSISSAVQEKVAFLNSLNNSPARQSPIRSEAPSSPSKRDALQRVTCGYEESQSSLASAHAEIERLNAVVKSQTRKLETTTNRIDKLLEQLTDEKAESDGLRKNYVKEVKKIRKQCFEAEKGQLELGEELRDAKKELKRKDAELQHERQKKDEARQESFERAYTVAGLTEEVEVLREKLKVVEQEKEAAILDLRSNAVRWAGRVEKEASSASMRAHEMVRKASQPEEMGDKDATPRPSKKVRLENSDHICLRTASTAKRPFFSDFVEDKAGMREFNDEAFTLEDHISELYREVACYKRLWKDSKDTVHLMYMECQFQTCECRRAEKNGKRFIYDHGYEMEMQERHAAKKRRIEEDKKANTLPPDPAPDHLTRVMEDSVMDEAVQVPLPSPQATRPNSRESTPEVTAILEDMTQVMVAPTASHTNSKFTFSTSTSGHVHSPVHSRAMAPPMARAETAMAAPIEADLFDMSPPKRHPPRPSTALGVMSTGLASPIRMVPDSPQPSNLARPAYASESATILSTTTRVALKDTSPLRGSHRRTQSRPNIRSQSRPRSPFAPVKSNPNLSKSTSASPSNSTVFPITPKTKSMHVRAQTHHHIPTVTAAQTFTTTTTIPLRDNEHNNVYSEQEFPHTPGSTMRAQTQPINMPMSVENDSQQSILNVPGTPVSREAALAQIRARRDRTRSLNLKNQPTQALKSAPGSAKRGITLRDAAGAGRNVDREVSVASMASAPGRFG